MTVALDAVALDAVATAVAVAIDVVATTVAVAIDAVTCYNIGSPSGLELNYSDNLYVF